MVKCPKWILILLVSLFWPFAAFSEEDTNSANFWQPKCRAAVLQRSTDFFGGACMGMALMLKQFGKYYQEPLRVCVPDSATIILVITRWIDNNPSQMHQSYATLALVASKAAWPCAHR